MQLHLSGKSSEYSLTAQRMTPAETTSRQERRRKIRELMNTKTWYCPTCHSSGNAIALLGVPTPSGYRKFRKPICRICGSHIIHMGEQALKKARKIWSVTP